MKGEFVELVGSSRKRVVENVVMCFGLGIVRMELFLRKMGRLRESRWIFLKVFFGCVVEIF